MEYHDENTEQKAKPMPHIEPASHIEAKPATRTEAAPKSQASLESNTESNRSVEEMPASTQGDFESLPPERKEAILAAGIEAFGLRDYKSARTEDIARRAGMSKGLLTETGSGALSRSVTLGVGQSTRPRLKNTRPRLTNAPTPSRTARS